MSNDSRWLQSIGILICVFLSYGYNLISQGRRETFWCEDLDQHWRSAGGGEMWGDGVGGGAEKERKDMLRAG